MRYAGVFVSHPNFGGFFSLWVSVATLYQFIELIMKFFKFAIEVLASLFIFSTTIRVFLNVIEKTPDVY